MDPLHLHRRDARILERLSAIDYLVGQLQRELAHARASANTVRHTLAALREIHSKVTGLIGDEFYGLDDLDESVTDDNVPLG